MNRLFTSASMTGLLLCATADVNAFTKPTHKRIVIDAVNYMATNPDTTAYTNRLF